MTTLITAAKETILAQVVQIMNKAIHHINLHTSNG